MMKQIAFIVFAALSCILKGQTVPAPDVKTLTAPHESGVETLNAPQRRTLEDYIRVNERLTGDLKVTVDREQIFVVSSDALRQLFPQHRFVNVASVYKADPGAKNKYSIPGTLFHTLVLDAAGKKCMEPRTGYLEEYALFLRDQKIKVVDQASADLARAALVDIYGTGMGLKNAKIGVSPDVLRRSQSEWHLGYQEFPFRAISSYEEVREASYYLLMTDPDGTVSSGKLVDEVLERRKIK